MLRSVTPSPNPVSLRRLEVCPGLTVGMDQVGDFARGVMVVTRPDHSITTHTISADHTDFSLLSEWLDGVFDGCAAMIAAGFVLPVPPLRKI